MSETLCSCFNTEERAELLSVARAFAHKYNKHIPADVHGFEAIKTLYTSSKHHSTNEKVPMDLFLMVVERVPKATALLPLEHDDISGFGFRLVWRIEQLMVSLNQGYKAHVYTIVDPKSVFELDMSAAIHQMSLLLKYIEMELFYDYRRDIRAWIVMLARLLPSTRQAQQCSFFVSAGFQLVDALNMLLAMKEANPEMLMAALSALSPDDPEDLRLPFRMALMGPCVQRWSSGDPGIWTRPDFHLTTMDLCAPLQFAPPLQCEQLLTTTCLVSQLTDVIVALVRLQPDALPDLMRAFSDLDEQGFPSTAARALTPPPPPPLFVPQPASLATHEQREMLVAATSLLYAIFWVFQQGGLLPSPVRVLAEDVEVWTQQCVFLLLDNKSIHERCWRTLKKLKLWMRLLRPFLQEAEDRQLHLHVAAMAPMIRDPTPA